MRTDMKRTLFAFAAAIAIYLVTPPFVVPLLAALPYTFTCTDGGAGDDGLDAPFAVIANNIITIATDTCRGDAVDAYSIAVLTGESPDDDQYAEIDSSLLTHTYVCVRASGANLGAFVGYCTTIAAGTAYLQEWSASGSAATIDSVANAATDGVLKIEIVDDDLEVFLDDVSILTHTDATITTGKHAVMFYSNIGRGEVMEFGNLEGGGGGPTCAGRFSLLGVGSC